MLLLKLDGPKLLDGGDYLCGVRIVTVKPMKKYAAFAE